MKAGDRLEVPGGTNDRGWGSDHIAELLRQMDFPYISLTPGASFRGLHDSLVNYLGNEDCKLMLALHEQSVVAIAHGYAKVAGEPMAEMARSSFFLWPSTTPSFSRSESVRSGSTDWSMAAWTKASPY